MAQPTMTTPTRAPRETRETQDTMEQGGGEYQHRTARVIEVIGTSRVGFEDAIRTAIEDARATLRDVRGAQVQSMSVKCNGAGITEYKVDMKLVFGVERTQRP